MITPPHLSEQTASEQPVIDFAIVTAIQVEREAICEAFGLIADNRVHVGAHTYWRGTFWLRSGEHYEIVVTQALDAANVDAAIVTTSMIYDWHPWALLMVGIAGAARDDQEYGDLVLGREIYYYERGKETRAGRAPEPKTFRADATLLNRALVAPNWEAAIPTERPDGKDALPRVQDGVIASGEKVIADEAVRDEIAAGNRRILAIEMEGYGVSAAVWQAMEPIHHLVIRSICDKASSEKNDEWHRYAAAAVASYVKHLLMDRPLEPRNPSATMGENSAVETNDGRSQQGLRMPLKPHDRVVEDLQALWNSVRSLDELSSPFLFLYHILAPEEYKGAYSNERLREHIPKTPSSDFWTAVEKINNAAELARPFVGERLWLLFRAYAVFTTRTALKVIKGREKNVLLPWYEDLNGNPESFSYLKEVLTEEEFNWAIRQPVVRFGITEWITQVLEARIASEINDIMWGQRRELGPHGDGGWV